MSRSTPLPTLVFMLESAQNAMLFMESLTKPDFLADLKTQAAVAMTLVNIGEGASKMMKSHQDVCAANPQIAWPEIVGLRNRIAHDYMSINFDAVWEMSHSALPELVVSLTGLLHTMGYKPSTGDS